MLLHDRTIATTVPNLTQGEHLYYKVNSNTNPIRHPYILEACTSCAQDSLAGAEASACGWRRHHRDAGVMQWPGCIVTWNALGVCFASSAVLATAESVQRFKSLSAVRFNARTAKLYLRAYKCCCSVAGLSYLSVVTVIYVAF